jgi:transposase InsO family protein
VARGQAEGAIASLPVELAAPADSPVSQGRPEDAAGLAATDPAAPPPPAGAATPSAPPPPAPPRLTEPIHHQRLREALNERGARAGSRPRDPAWQRQRRQRDRVIRADVVALWADYQNAGVSAQEAAALLGMPARTLRQWQHDLRAGLAEVKILGRPHARATPEQADQVMAFLHGHGPWVGTPTLGAEFPTVPPAELRDLLGVFRHLWAGAHPRERLVLHWHRVGAVWAMDFHEARQPIDGRFPYVFAARDLASGLQLAWRPVREMTTAAVVRELLVLFTIYGAPLVLKSDNGSAFRAEALKRFLRRWQVWPLYSPPATPGYNGAIEASIGSLKTRTQWEAYRGGHAGVWTSADLAAARVEHNSTARPRGRHGPTPAEAWAGRRPPTQFEHDAFSALVGPGEAAARRQSNIALETVLDHYEQAALHRRVLTQVLVEGGLLTITRRRIPQRFFGQTVANIK